MRKDRIFRAAARQHLCPSATVRRHGVRSGIPARTVRPACGFLRAVHPDRVPRRKADGAHRKGLYAVRQDHARTACGGEKICHQPCGEPRGVLRPRGYFADPLQCSYRGGDAYRLYFAFRKGACRFCAEIRAGDGQRRHRVLPGLFQIRAPRSDHHRDPHDRHLLVGSLPAHHVSHDHRRRGDRRSDRAGGV